jgi:RimJ/RimL family protein N-acetyltransferase
MTAALQTARLTLRQPAGLDIDRLVTLAGDLEVARHLERVPHPYGAEDARTWLASLAAPTPAETAFALDDGTGLIGVVSFHALDETPEIGYWLGRRYWRDGYMSEAAVAALSWLFRTTEADTVTARVRAINTASLAMLDKIGFRVAGSDDRSRQTVQTRLERADFLRLHDHMNGTAADGAAQKATQR